MSSKQTAACNNFLLPIHIQGFAPVNWQINKQANLPVPMTLFSGIF